MSAKERLGLDYIRGLHFAVGSSIRELLFISTIERRLMSSKGNYFWRFEAFTAQQERLFCVEADVCLDRDDNDPRNGDTCPPVRERGSYIGELQQVVRDW